MVSEVETNPPDFKDFEALHALLSDSFADMAGRIDPPSSITRLTPDGLADKVKAEDLFLVRAPQPVACIFGSAEGDAYALRKLAVARGHRGRGLCRALIAACEMRARRLGLPALRLQSRVELAGTHAVFAALGFEEAGRTAHPGFARPTSVTFVRRI